MKQIFATLLAGAALLAAPVASAKRDGDTPDAQLAKMIEGRVAGKPVDCINLGMATSSTVVDGKAIVYRSGATLYVNEPRAGADRLDDDSILVTNTFGSQLCSVDAVHLVDRFGYFPRGFVLLGKFVPYTREKKAS